MSELLIMEVYCSRCVHSPLPREKEIRTRNHKIETAMPRSGLGLYHRCPLSDDTLCPECPMAFWDNATAVGMVGQPLTLLSSKTHPPSLFLTAGGTSPLATSVPVAHIHTPERVVSTRNLRNQGFPQLLRYCFSNICFYVKMCSKDLWDYKLFVCFPLTF